ncbi:hypothetical protein DFA_08305 [Cavenderia fasciculata]|uniref:Transmembrane protein n=1 Tax=Cavenderia fasciculata TaxID=261658 RepID=F4Q5Q3_CACFS|nr:uncharacterized protein DFA_08305 [Cavenderia fasciculata]EGG17312.1 hypothetical protein DFA_08305 [Cavenderia fasciculata]|eukprot:XP_004355796.1 hypothetical protein DFA_08305 [Cavenderia fasciculata]
MVFGSINNWRNAKVFKPAFNNILPGFKPAVVLFTAYCVIEGLADVISPSKDAHH